MKLSQNFADITKLKDIDEVALGTYLSQELYALLPTAALLHWHRLNI